MRGDYLPLTPQQIAQMEARGCRAENWNDITATEGFDAAAVRNCAFRGRVRLSAGVTISNVGVHISNCEIGPGARIEGVGMIDCPEGCSFGIGVRVAAINENGGRAVPLHTDISAQTAYIMAMYRHRSKAIAKLEEIVEGERRQATGGMCTIGAGARLTACGIIRGVNIGEGAQLEGVLHLENGTILSSVEAPAKVGQGVMCVDFIFARSSRVESGASLKRCFVGEGAMVDEGFTGMDSLFFANCIMAGGEACSIFAGPYTVSHHKSTLLIAGLFSFFNAGSGANQSNHLFRTGPVHQGINERGSKYGSNTYIMLPARTGAFTTVLGSHSSHHDTSDFPFSYLMELEEKSHLIPGIALRSYGVVRDLAKWPARDKRPERCRDIINFEQYNPYIASRVERALEISADLLANTGLEVYTYGRIRIKYPILKRGRELYRLMMDASLGAMLESGAEPGCEGRGEWVDMAGMYAPVRLVTRLMERIEAGEFSSMPQILEELRRIHAGYASYACGWALSKLDAGKDTDGIIEKGRKARATLQKYTTDDAVKDSDLMMATGYGADFEDPQIKAGDFEAVRGIKIKQ